MTNNIVMQNTDIDRNIIKKINDNYTFCKVKYQSHTKAAEKYNMLYIYTTAPVIIISTITTILASYNGLSGVQWLAILVAITSGITTVGQSLISFLEFKNKYQSHFITAKGYMKLIQMLNSDFYPNYFSREITSDPVLREKYVKTFFADFYTKLTNLQDVEPVLPPDISNLDLLNTRIGVNEVDDVLIEMQDLPHTIINMPNTPTMPDTSNTPNVLNGSSINSIPAGLSTQPTTPFGFHSNPTSNSSLIVQIPPRTSSQTTNTGQSQNQTATSNPSDLTNYPPSISDSRQPSSMDIPNKTTPSIDLVTQPTMDRKPSAFVLPPSP